MKFKELLAEKINLPANILPSGYHILGHVLLLKLSKKALRHKKKIGSSILQMFPYIKTVALQKGVSGEFRLPKVEILAGNKNTKTIHRELNCTFKLDASKIMWSKGNHFERQRMLQIVRPNEIVVDMFAGIGYWSVILSKHAKARWIICLEKNPKSFNYLIENISLNKLQNITAIETDCRNFSTTMKADRIIMGYFPGTLNFLPYALNISKKGTIIHFHEIAKNHESLKKAILKHKSLKITNIRQVKEYSPSKRHFVFDLEVKHTKF